MREIITDGNGKLSMMRLAHLICMSLSTILVFAGIFFATKDVGSSDFISASIVFAGIGTAGKATQKYTEK